MLTSPKRLSDLNKTCACVFLHQVHFLCPQDVLKIREHSTTSPKATRLFEPILAVMIFDQVSTTFIVLCLHFFKNQLM